MSLAGEERDREVTILPVGLTATVTVPASSANLGPGFDSLGLALGLYDDVTVETTDGGLTVTVEGEGWESVPTDETHLVVLALRRAMTCLGIAAPGLNLKCHNRIPHSRGLGSSAAAAVAGIAAGTALAAEGGVPRSLTAGEMVQLSAEFEGHPDNASASVLGGAVVSWTGPGPAYDARRIEVHPDVKAYAFVPDVESSTSVTRGLLPDKVPHADAAFNASRSALLVVALSQAPELLLPATDDRLHQGYRAGSMPASAALVADLRADGVAAFVSGAGPTVLALTASPLPGERRESAQAAGFTVRELSVADGVSIADS
ncbi:homoserine kinase [Tsukamurella sp. 8F]|uniref:homoserine kinase n=1 Tax=unclassified Tsukamurella TaxID=2633480 RepID=UPI0023B8B541|nr:MULTISPECIES: homoserine kinase [unclassified Tsukamurella]MDF0530320.1 homoserine kinase [Tsukamurella sp. 8J]MDF0587617.1 homoserine kinase [Tsukamurella sp. 8F]